MNLRAIGIKTLLIMMTDLLLVTIGLFTGILSALAFDRGAWSQEFWMFSLISIGCSLGTAVIGWWAWLQLRYKKG